MSAPSQVDSRASTECVPVSVCLDGVSVGFEQSDQLDGEPRYVLRDISLSWWPSGEARLQGHLLHEPRNPVPSPSRPGMKKPGAPRSNHRMPRRFAPRQPSPPGACPSSRTPTGVTHSPRPVSTGTGGRNQSEGLASCLRGPKMLGRQSRRDEQDRCPFLLARASQRQHRISWLQSYRASPLNRNRWSNSPKCTECKYSLLVSALCLAIERIISAAIKHSECGEASRCCRGDRHDRRHCLMVRSPFVSNNICHRISYLLMILYLPTRHAEY
jgi:hypothetical protein